MKTCLEPDMSASLCVFRATLYIYIYIYIYIILRDKVLAQEKSAQRKKKDWKGSNQSQLLLKVSRSRRSSDGTLSDDRLERETLTIKLGLSLPVFS